MNTEYSTGAGAGGQKRRVQKAHDRDDDASLGQAFLPHPAKTADTQQHTKVHTHTHIGDQLAATHARALSAPRLLICHSPPPNLSYRHCNQALNTDTLSSNTSGGGSPNIYSGVLKPQYLGSTIITSGVPQCHHHRQSVNHSNARLCLKRAALAWATCTAPQKSPPCLSPRTHSHFQRQKELAWRAAEHWTWPDLLSVTLGRHTPATNRYLNPIIQFSQFLFKPLPSAISSNYLFTDLFGHIFGTKYNSIYTQKIPLQNLLRSNGHIRWRDDTLIGGLHCLRACHAASPMISPAHGITPLTKQQGGVPRRGEGVPRCEQEGKAEYLPTPAVAQPGGRPAPPTSPWRSGSFAPGHEAHSRLVSHSLPRYLLWPFVKGLCLLNTNNIEFGQSIYRNKT